MPLERLPKDRGLLDRLGIAPDEDDSLSPIPAAMVGMIPVKVRMWLQVAHQNQPVIMAWCPF